MLEKSQFAKISRYTVYGLRFRWQHPRFHPCCEPSVKLNILLLNLHQIIINAFKEFVEQYLAQLRKQQQTALSVGVELGSPRSQADPKLLGRCWFLTLAKLVTLYIVLHGYKLSELTTSHCRQPQQYDDTVEEHSSKHYTQPSSNISRIVNSL